MASGGIRIENQDITVNQPIAKDFLTQCSCHLGFIYLPLPSRGRTTLNAIRNQEGLNVQSSSSSSSIQGP